MSADLDLSPVLNATSAEELVAAAKNAGITLTDADVAEATESVQPHKALLKLYMGRGRIGWSVQNLYGSGPGPVQRWVPFHKKVDRFKLPPGVINGIYILSVLAGGIRIKICDNDEEVLHEIGFATPLPPTSESESAAGLPEWKGHWTLPVIQE